MDCEGGYEAFPCITHIARSMIGDFATVPERHGFHGTVSGKCRFDWRRAGNRPNLGLPGECAVV